MKRERSAALFAQASQRMPGGVNSPVRSFAHVGEVPVLGLPGCVMYHKASIFDLIVPRLLAGVKVGAADIAALGHGGYCAGCGECRYPVCPFGKN